jgi:putative sigma-54 modulation protein
MTFTLTARHFKAHDSLKEFAEAELEKVKKYFDGIIKTEVILSYDKPANSIKNAEIIVHAKNHTFTATESSDDFPKSIELAMLKIQTQVKKFKDKITDHSADRVAKLTETSEETE